MKTIIACFVILLSLAASPAAGDDLFIEAGPGIVKSFDSAAVFVRYRHDTSNLFDRPSFYDFFGAHWNGTARANAAGIARGIAWNKAGKEDFLTGTFGFLALDRLTVHSGTRLQFYFRVAYDLTVEGCRLSFGIIHISNGKFVFGWNGPNSGENFLTVSFALF